MRAIRHQQRPLSVSDAAVILAALPDAVIVLDGQDRVVSSNAAGEQMFSISAPVLRGMALGSLCGAHHPVVSLVEQVRRTGASVSEDDVEFAGPRFGARNVSVRAAPLPETIDHVVMLFHERSIARKIDQQLVHRGSARSVSAMAAMLAHEVKNPLSGIRGAAQLLEQSAPPQDQELTRLIRDETDRICALVDRMEEFADIRPIQRAPVNIHEVLERVRLLAQSGFASAVRFVERYDPSLPPVLGNRDQLIQVLLNLVKNAAEAAPAEGGEIVLVTAYRPGVRLAVPGTHERLHLPLAVSVQDNGPGIPSDIRGNLFDPFVTTKANGTGLGLALVAKLIGDHGGVIEYDSEPRRTVFRVMLPVVDSGRSARSQNS
jgi:two-component system, NtrC family, nitrogen regulation sensor histidine kinase GlnL